MASSVSWACQSCIAQYSSLFQLVSHVRRVHTEDTSLSFVCGVQGCSIAFTKTNTWYKHVVKHHRNEYLCRSLSDSVNANSEEGSSTDGFGEADDDISDVCIIEDDCNVEHNSDVHSLSSEDNNANIPPSDSTVIQHSSTQSHSMPFFSKDVIAGKLFKIREHHLVSHAAVDEVVNLVQSSCDGILNDALFAIWKSGEASHMDMSSDYFQNLPKVFENLSTPLDSISTAYKQQSYIAKQLPYVVSIM